MSNLIRIAFFTIKDQVRQKSFYLLLAVAVLFILIIRSCYHADYSVNGQKMDNVSLAWHASLLVFALLFSPVSTIMGIVSNVISRRHEFSADRFAWEHTHTPALADALNTLLSDDALAEALGRGARARSEKLFSGPALGRAYSDLFHEVAVK